MEIFPGCHPLLVPCKWQDKVWTLSCSLPLDSLPWRETCTRPLEWSKRKSHSAVWMMRKARSWAQQRSQLLSDLLLGKETFLGFHGANPKLSVLQKGAGTILWQQHGELCPRAGPKYRLMLHSGAKDTRKPGGCPFFSWLYLVNPCYLNLLSSDGAVPDTNPASEMLSQCVAFSVQASAITKQKQFHNICRNRRT